MVWGRHFTKRACETRGGSRLVDKGFSIGRSHVSFYLRTDGSARDDTCIVLPT